MEDIGITQCTDLSTEDSADLRNCIRQELKMEATIKIGQRTIEYDKFTLHLHDNCSIWALPDVYRELWLNNKTGEGVSVSIDEEGRSREILAYIGRRRISTAKDKNCRASVGLSGDKLIAIAHFLAVQSGRLDDFKEYCESLFESKEI